MVLRFSKWKFHFDHFLPNQPIGLICLGNVATTKNRNTASKSVRATPHYSFDAFNLSSIHLWYSFKTENTVFIFRQKLMHLQGGLCNVAISKYRKAPNKSIGATHRLLIWCFLVYYQPSTYPLSFHTLNYLFIYDICSVINI